MALTATQILSLINRILDRADNARTDAEDFINAGIASITGPLSESPTFSPAMMPPFGQPSTENVGPAELPTYSLPPVQLDLLPTPTKHTLGSLTTFSPTNLTIQEPRFTRLSPQQIDPFIPRDIAPFEIPDSPGFSDIDDINETFTAVEPTLNIPLFNRDINVSIPEFTTPVPDVNTSFNEPASPDIVVPELNRRDLDDITIPDISLPSLNIIEPDNDLPDFQSLVDGLDGALERYRSILMPEGVPTVSEFNPYEGPFYELFQRIEDFGYEARLYEQLRTRIIAEGDGRQLAVDDAARGAGWDLPGGVRFAGQMAMAMDHSRQLSVAAVEAFTRSADREVQQRQFLLTLSQQVWQVSQELKFRRAEFQIEAAKASAQYADTVFRAALAQYQAGVERLRLQYAFIDAQIRKFEGELRGALAQVELVRARLDVERLKIDADTAAVRELEAMLGVENLKVQLYGSQINALRTLGELRRLPLELFGYQVQAFQANLEGKKTEISAAVAEIEGDKAKLEGELGRLRVFQTQADVFNTKVQAARAKIDSQAARNQSLLAIFDAELRGRLGRLDADTKTAQADVAAYQAQTSAILGVTGVDVEVAKLENQHQQSVAQLQVSRAELDLARSRAVAEIDKLKLERDKANADMDLSYAVANADIAKARADMSVKVGDLALGAYRAELDQIRAVEALEIERARLVMQELMGNKELQAQVTDADRQFDLSKFQAEIARTSAISQSNIAGANLAGQIANSLYSSISAIASTSTNAEAPAPEDPE